MTQEFRQSLHQKLTIWLLPVGTILMAFMTFMLADIYHTFKENDRLTRKHEYQIQSLDSQRKILEDWIGYPGKQQSANP